MDTITPAQRSDNMRAIRSTNTKPEIYLRKLLFARGFRYRLYSKKVPGKPDLYLRKYNTALFVNGCFWHHHAGCRYGYMPKSRQDYWTGKFDRNEKRDAEVKILLKEKGIRQLVIWECLIKKMMKDKKLEAEVVHQIIQFLQNPEIQFLELPENQSTAE